MSVGRGGGGQGWEELEKQQISAQTAIPDSEFPTGGLSEWGQTEYTIAPVGGLDRQEIAELIAIESYGIFAFSQPSGDEVGISVSDCEVELSLNPDQQMIGPAPVEETTDTFVDDASGETVTINKNLRESTSTDVLFWSKPHNWIGWDDETNGSGGGSTMHMDHWHRNYRELLGGGPEVDQHDTLYLYQSLGQHNMTNSPINLYNNFHLYWDVRTTR